MDDSKIYLCFTICVSHLRNAPGHPQYILQYGYWKIEYANI